MSKTIRLYESVDDADIGVAVKEIVMRRTWWTLWLRSRPVTITRWHDTDRKVEIR